MTGDRTPYRILIVDDKELDRNGVCYLIRQYGLELEPITAASGLEALDILHQQTVHILLTDVKMPGMTGHDLIAAAKDIQPDLKVIIFSSYENFDYAHKAMDLGVTKYLLKPIKVDKFLTCMQSIILLLREEERTRLSSMYFNVMSGLYSPNSEQPEMEEKAGHVLLLDFVEPFFNSHHLDLFDEQDGPIAIPLNEYECAFISPPADVQSCMERLKQALAQEENCRYILINGGPFENITQLSELYSRMESLSSSKFYLSRSTVVDMTRPRAEPSGIDVRHYLEKAAEIGKLVMRRELQHAEAEIEDIFSELQKQITVPTSLAKFISNELIKAGLSESQQDYNATLLQYISEIEHSTNIEDLKSLCIRMVRQYSAQDEETVAIDQALDIIHRDYMHNISLESVASDVYLSTCYLSYLFKKTTGMNFIKYLTSYRVDMAKNLLRTTKLKVGNICEMVGYSNVSYFCQIFKNHTGMTPAQFRGSKL